MIGGIHRATGHSIRVICATLEVPGSSYYHAAARASAQISDHAPGDRIKGIFTTRQRRYG